MLGATTPRQRQSQDQPDRKDKLARPEIQARPGTGGARGTLETRVNQARPEIQARLETGAVQDTPETWAKPARLETQGKREGVAIRVYKARPRHVRQESIATRTAILEERVVSGIKTGSSYFILINMKRSNQEFRLDFQESGIECRRALFRGRVAQQPPAFRSHG